MVKVENINFRTADGRVINNELYVNNDEADSLVVLFPGGNYGCDKPLLYYARKAATELGKDVLCLSYSKKISKDDIESRNVEIIGNEVQSVIKKALIKKYKNIYFISKSIGTEVAGFIADKLGYENIHLMFLTPTKGTVKHISKAECTVIVGSSDGLFSKENLERIKKYTHIKLIIVEGGNHSLDVQDDVVKSVQWLQKIVKAYMEFLN